MENLKIKWVLLFLVHILFSREKKRSNVMSFKIKSEKFNSLFDKHFYKKCVGTHKHVFSRIFFFILKKKWKMKMFGVVPSFQVTIKWRCGANLGIRLARLIWEPDRVQHEASSDQKLDPNKIFYEWLRLGKIVFFSSRLRIWHTYIPIS